MPSGHTWLAYGVFTLVAMDLWNGRFDSATPRRWSKVKVRIKAPLNTRTAARKARLKPARNASGKVPRHAVKHTRRRRPSAAAAGGVGRRVW